MTRHEQIRWLKTRQASAKQILDNAAQMVIGTGIVRWAEEDLEATTALLATLQDLEDRLEYWKDLGLRLEHRGAQD